MHPRRRSIALAALITGATLVPLVAFGGIGLAQGFPSASQYQYSPSANQYKIAVCHYTHSAKHPWVIIRISKSAWPAHQRHGDTMPPPCGVKQSSAKTHGKGTTTHGKSTETHGKSTETHGQSTTTHGQSDSNASTGTTNAGGDHGNGHGNGKH
jgi:hypothetical protein